MRSKSAGWRLAGVGVDSDVDIAGVEPALPLVAVVALLLSSARSVPPEPASDGEAGHCNMVFLGWMSSYTKLCAYSSASAI